MVGNSGGPAFNDQGECIGVAFQVKIPETALKLYISRLICHDVRVLSPTL